MMTYWIHLGCGFFMALYALLALLWNSQMKKLSREEENYRKKNQVFFYFNRMAMYVAVIAFLVGGKLGTPYFKTGSGWIYTKLVLWALLLALLGFLGARPLKSRKKALEAEDKKEEPFQKAQRDLNLFVWANLFLVASMMALGHWKPF